MIEQTVEITIPKQKLTVVDKLRMLLDITKEISRSLNLEDLMKMVMDTLGSLIPNDAAAIYLLEKDQSGAFRFRTESLRGYEVEDLADIKLQPGEGIVGYVVQSGNPVLANDVRENDHYYVARQHTQSELCVPIISNDEVIGVINLENDELNAFEEDDLQVLSLLASQVATIVEKVQLHEHLIEKKRLQGQLEVAREVQLELFPDHDPHLVGFDISAYNFPTEQVSGDYYDWVRIFEDQIGVVIADASGKGIPAALLMAFLRATLRAAAHVGYAPHISLTKANYLLWESIENNQFVTAIYGILDATNKTFVFANAGHNPLLLLKENGEAQFIERGGLPLGMFRETRYYEHFLQLEADQILVLYTDGITEAMNESGEEFSKERLVECVRRGKELEARELVNLIHQEVTTFSGENTLEDDGTLFIIKTS
ncbi:MAG TPA: GAF domain-containing SpoIIE family protein phosphatase [Pyrinomonadaceae bacterium]|jgi:serine phosphatase RsbU (regulator of sigma subunit)